MATVRAGSGFADAAFAGRPAGAGGGTATGFTSPGVGFVQSMTRADRAASAFGGVGAPGAFAGAAFPVAPSTRSTDSSTRRRTSLGSMRLTGGSGEREKRGIVGAV